MTQVGINAIGKRKINDTIDTAEGHCGLCTVPRQRTQPFSFATGLSDGIVSENQPQMNHPGQVNVVGTFVDVLPMIPGTETGNGPPTLTDNNQAIYDPATGTTWPVDANPAATLVATYTPRNCRRCWG